MTARSRAPATASPALRAMLLASRACTLRSPPSTSTSCWTRLRIPCRRRASSPSSAAPSFGPAARLSSKGQPAHLHAVQRATSAREGACVTSAAVCAPIRSAVSTRLASPPRRRVCAGARACVCTCARACVRAHALACVHACVRGRARVRETMAQLENLHCPVPTRNAQLCAHRGCGCSRRQCTGGGGGGGGFRGCRGGVPRRCRERRC